MTREEKGTLISGSTGMVAGASSAVAGVMTGVAGAGLAYGCFKLYEHLASR